MLKQIKHLFSLAATFVAIVSVCFALWIVVGLCIGFGFTVGKAIAGFV